MPSSKEAFFKQMADAAIAMHAAETEFIKCLEEKAAELGYDISTQRIHDSIHITVTRKQSGGSANGTTATDEGKEGDS